MPKKNNPGCQCCDDTETVILTGCPCNGVIAGEVPVSLTISATYGGGTYPGIFDSDLVYRTAPSWVNTNNNGGSPVHWSTSPYVTVSGVDYWYTMTCFLGAYYLWTVSENWFGPGLPGGGAIRAFSIGVGGNRCHKPSQTFLLHYGVAPGGGSGGIPYDAIVITE